MSRARKRKELLDEWAQGLTSAAQAGAFGHPVTVGRAIAIGGPRAGALELWAGMQTGNLLSALARNDCATLRQFVPWDFHGDPAAYMSGRYLRVEAGWPDKLAEVDIPLGDLGRHPTGGGRWIAGKSEAGATVTLGIDGQNPHYLIGGQTGSGKTWAMRSALFQLAQDPANRLVLIDAKWGSGFRTLRGLPGVVGPLADTPEAARAAISWTAREMRRRFEAGDYRGRVIVAVDEVQELDEAALGIVQRLVSLGREAGVHVLLGTQHPTKEALGDTATKRNLTGRLALRVEDGVASTVVVGRNSPRADNLLGAGDAYAVVPGRVQRLQLAYIPPRALQRYDRDGDYPLTAWPPFDPEALGRLPEDDGGDHVSGSDEPAEVGAAIEAAYRGRGRPWLRDRLEGVTGSRPGGSKSQRLLSLGRDIYDWLTEEAGIVLGSVEGETD